MVVGKVHDLQCRQLAVGNVARELEEAQRDLILKRDDEGSIRRRFRLLRQNFPEWEVEGYEALIGPLKCDEKDRHVLAVAIRCGASQIVTSNVKDFPDSALAPFNIEAISPDDFLLNVLELSPKDVAAVLREQAAALNKPTLTVDEVLAELASCGAPNFAREASTVIAATS